MNAQQVWLAQATLAPRISLEYIRHQARSLERVTRMRAAFVYVVYVLVFGFLGWRAAQYFSYLRPLQLAALAWYGLFTIYYMYRLHRHVATQVNPGDAGVLDTLRFHRRQLERQRDFRRRTWRWAVPALLPGVGLQLAAMITSSFPWQRIAFFVAVMSLAITVSIVLGELRARRTQREIDALDSLAGSS